MTVAFTVSNAQGEILRTGNAATMEQALLQGNTVGNTVITADSDPVTQQVVAGAVVARPSTGLTIDKVSFLANGTDKVTISGITAGSTYSIVIPVNSGLDFVPGSSIPNADTTFSMTTDTKGAYQISIKNFPKIDYLVTVNAT